MKNFPLDVLLFVVVLLPTSAPANSCSAKRIKVQQVCGIVVDLRGIPIPGASLQVMNEKGAAPMPAVLSDGDGRFFLTDVEKGDASLATTAPYFDRLKWPLKITGKTKGTQCKKPIFIHLSIASGMGCGSWVDWK
jgi:hypothetical protein